MTQAIEQAPANSGKRVWIEGMNLKARHPQGRAAALGPGTATRDAAGHVRA
jgi:hypothetical protein